MLAPLSRHFRPCLARHPRPLSRFFHASPYTAQKVDPGPKNEVGVQLLSPSLHSQVFGDVKFPPPDPAFIQIARDHLSSHSLDTTQASVLPPISFDLPPLQGKTLDHHFHTIGAAVAEPHLSLAKRYAEIDLPPLPDTWVHQSGWTKYHPDGLFESVDSPGDESMLCFDIETMPVYHPYPIMACAASPTAWYAWVSPWLLGESEDPLHLIPLGNPNTPRVIIGHNVAYDRARVKEEYALKRTANRYIDTMALHVAVKGISSPQRPGWMVRRKEKRQAKVQQEESIATVKALVDQMDKNQVDEPDTDHRANLKTRKDALADGLLEFQSSGTDDDADVASKRWEDVTAVNSLLEVARLYCGINMDKAARDDLMTSTPDAIRSKLDDYLTYCATDVSTTQAVFRKVLPAFLDACPSPVSWAGATLMGNGFLPVDESWNEYVANAESKYRSLEDQIRGKLETLAVEAKALMDVPEEWKDNEWLSQLDWSPKVPGKSRGATPPAKPASTKGIKLLSVPLHQPERFSGSMPTWYFNYIQNPFSPKNSEITVLLLRLSWLLPSQPLFLSSAHGWVYRSDSNSSGALEVAQDDTLARYSLTPGQGYLRPDGFKNRLQTLLGQRVFRTGQLMLGSPSNASLLARLCDGNKETTQVELLALADDAIRGGSNEEDPWLMQLDWTPLPFRLPQEAKAVPSPVESQTTWPKWFWELTSPKKGKEPGALDLTVRNRVAPVLLRLRWLGWPLFYSRQHGWTFRAESRNFKTSLTPLTFVDDADEKLVSDGDVGYKFYKLPHKDGDSANVGSPLSKTFMKYFETGILTSPGHEAKEALDMNAQCSYWISARDRVMKQLVLWDGGGGTSMGLEAPDPEGRKLGMILPQVITMGTVTRRAIENTWLTASNAKANRVGSELKAMVRAPAGYSIVGADVDSEELWISSLMGDAQFGLHGATALGWMTLEGQKKFGTDLHSKTAQILGVSRDQAKVFNYSRIYGAGKRHAALLLRQSNPSMLPEEAQKLAKALYASTKGKSTRRKDLFFDRGFWHGGTESFVFNKLEGIALSELPRTPALGCMITRGLQKEYLVPGFGTDFMPSRINWVVQSSGVDYLHLLIVAMEHLLSKYDIEARYLISVHDEVRYLVKEEDKYRCALALQIANLWTRSLFAYKLGMDNLPQGVAFFSAVDIDHVLRKEVDLPCVTPSQPNPIPPGENVDIMELLAKTNNGSLLKDSMVGVVESESPLKDDVGYHAPDCLTHRATSAASLRAQSTSESEEIRMLAQKEKGVIIAGKTPRTKIPKKKLSRATPPKRQDDDWDQFAENEMQLASRAS